MLDRVRQSLSYANVMSTIAVFAVLGGGAYAATKVGPNDIAKNAVRAKHIKKNQVLAKHVKKSQVASRHLKRNAVTAAKVATGAVGARAIADGSVTGAEVAESSLGIVPNADLLDGLDSSAFLRGSGRVHGQVLADAVDVSPTAIDLDIGGTLGLTCRTPASAGSSLMFTNTSGTTADVWTEKMQGTASPSALAVAYSSVPNGGNAMLSVSGPVVLSGESLLRFTIAVGGRVSTIDAKLVFGVDGCRAPLAIVEPSA